MGVARVLSADAGGALALDRPLPGGPGRRVYLWRAGDAHDYAGQGGFTFARVMRDQEGRPLAPHFVARDVERDNRLKPGQAWRSAHLFAARCDAPAATARLLYRPYPLWLARERGWDRLGLLRDEVIAAEAAAAARAPAAPLPPGDPGYEPPGGPAAQALTLALPPPSAEARRAARDAAEALGLDPDEEREGDPARQWPAPPLALAVGEEAALRVDDAGGAHARGPLALRQSLLAQPLAPNPAARLTPLRAHAAGAAAYELRPAAPAPADPLALPPPPDEVWRGAALALPAPLLDGEGAARGGEQLYALTLSRAEARAATRRARPWPWRLSLGAPPPLDLLPSAAESPRALPLDALPALDLSRVTAWVNLSSLPLLLDLPPGVRAWGGEAAPTLLRAPAPRYPLPHTQRAALLRVPPGEGVLLWAEATIGAGLIAAYGDTHHGGRAPTPPTPLARVVTPPEGAARLAARLGVSPDNPGALVSALLSHLGPPVPLDTPLAAEASLAAESGHSSGAHSGDLFLAATAELASLDLPYAPPPLSWAAEDGGAERLRALLAPGAPPAPLAALALTGGVRAAAWRLSAPPPAPDGWGRGEVVEVRNLSSAYARLWVEGAPHRLLTARGLLTGARRVSWLPPRGVGRVVRLGGGALRVEP
ncbi:MAG: hypothetical protein FJ138_13990 [Deltaproteobacteria bacterium]|nr:hypothetical protein [Deltaproteobacteria bacterium]